MIISSYRADKYEAKSPLEKSTEKFRWIIKKQGAKEKKGIIGLMIEAGIL
jgi:hypothetical protein